MARQSEQHQTTRVPLKAETVIERVLVVVTPDLIKAPYDSALLRRAIALAKVTGCELEFLHVCYDRSIATSLFLPAEERERRRSKCLDQDDLTMWKLVEHMKSKGVAAKHDTRWGERRSDVILSKIRQSKPDLVMKRSREVSYVMGLLRNADWDLIRQSPAHVWFVDEGGSASVNRVVSAVGGSNEGTQLIEGPDYDVFSVAGLISKLFNAENFAVHAYELPLESKGAYAPDTREQDSSLVEGALPDDPWRAIAESHGRSIVAFAQYFGLEPEQVQLAEGDPADVLPDVANSLGADLIVLAARNLSRWERFSQSVTAEPLLANAPCDVVFVKDLSNSTAYAQDGSQQSDETGFDLEHAIVHPKRTFGSPEAVVEATDLSEPLKHRILQLWEIDVVHCKRTRDDDESAQKAGAGTLDAINRARANLESSRQGQVN